eukprot:CAMPEP_0202769806 /NCGR_PEP_ID=MMETSP1388-20130828/37432_1 /ASSEMBLY_ACC=CAM_ASM_000864 /TAXON_ID=37098 /ORGANISM="Isochrysis sp, Strain CCMP1244" /LENGTH=45 /DNA_ID= /DNA_START= /DNA_END= /DNA_ORIENTATION=
MHMHATMWRWGVPASLLDGCNGARRLSPPARERAHGWVKAVTTAG